MTKAAIKSRRWNNKRKKRKNAQAIGASNKRMKKFIKAQTWNGNVSNKSDILYHKKRCRIFCTNENYMNQPNNRSWYNSAIQLINALVGFKTAYI